VQTEHRVADRTEKPLPIIEKEIIVQVPQIVQRMMQVIITEQKIEEIEIIGENIVVQDSIN